MKKRALYLDMDGVLANFEHGLNQHKEKPTPWLTEEKFFRNLPTINNPALELQVLVKNFNIYILTKVETRDTEQRAIDKKEWIKEHLPFIKEKNIIIVPYHERKIDYIPENGILVDDYKVNLIEWLENGKGMAIKFGKVLKATRNYPQITNLSQLETIL